MPEEIVNPQDQSQAAAPTPKSDGAEPTQEPGKKQPEELLTFTHPEEEKESRSETADQEGQEPEARGAEKPPQGQEGQAAQAGEFQLPKTFKVYGREIPTEGIMGQDGKLTETGFQLIQKGLAAGTALAKVSQERKAIANFRALIEKMRNEPSFYRHVMAYQEGGQAAGEGAAREPGKPQHDPELEELLKSSPALRGLAQKLDRVERLEKTVQRLDGDLGPMAAINQAVDELEASAGRVAGLGGDPKEYSQFVEKSLYPALEQLRASPDPQDREYARFLDDNPGEWERLYFARKAKLAAAGAQTNRTDRGQEAPAERKRTVKTKPIPRQALPRDTSGAGAGQGEEEDDWRAATEKAMRTGRQTDIDKALAMRLGTRRLFQ